MIKKFERGYVFKAEKWGEDEGFDGFFNVILKIVFSCFFCSWYERGCRQ